MESILEMFNEGIENNGNIIIKTYHDESKFSSNRSIVENIESYFFQHEYFISGISYHKSINDSYKRQKSIKEAKRLIISENKDKEEYTLSLYEILYIEPKFRNINTLLKFKNFFKQLKDVVYLKDYFSHDFGADNNPALLTFSINLKDNKKSKKADLLAEIINNMITEDDNIRKWANMTAKNIRVVNKHIGFMIPSEGILDFDEYYKYLSRRNKGMKKNNCKNNDNNNDDDKSLDFIEIDF